MTRELRPVSTTEPSPDDPFVWGIELSSYAQLAVFHLARALYDGDDDGVRLSHVKFTSDLMKYRRDELSAEIEKENSTATLEDMHELQRMQDGIGDLSTYLLQNSVVVVPQIEAQPQNQATPETGLRLAS